MDRKDSLDTLGVFAMLLFATLFAFNQVIIKVTLEGLSPMFAAGLRSCLGVAALGLWVWWRGISLRVTRGQFWGGCLIGVLFTTEFIFLFLALDLSTVSRASVIFYTMPIWLGLIAHFVLPGERLSGVRLLGFGIAISGVALAFWDGLTGHAAGEASVWGDVFAFLAALLWAGIALSIRLTPVSQANAETQLMFQLVMSGVVFLAIAPLFGPLLRAFEPIHGLSILFQSLFVVLLGFLLWFRLMKIYPASDIAAFSFLSPVLSVILGWWLLREEVGLEIIAALVLVCTGLLLISRKRGS